jgi:hypothetical protein
MLPNESEKRKMTETEFENLCGDVSDVYHPDYSGSAEEADALLNDICRRVYYKVYENPRQQYFPLPSYQPGRVQYEKTLDALMNGAQAEPFNHAEIARRHINKALNSTDD